MARATMLVYSHLRWDFVYQRPQHVMSRMAEERRVLFIEEPLGGADADGWERVDPRKNLTVYRPRLRGEVQGFDPAAHGRLADLLETLAATERIGRHTAWLYTPLAYPAAHTLAPEVIVYDCMDELANRNASPELPVIEAQLLRHADLVLTAGPSLYRAKKDRHPNVHCFPSSVDVAHFRKGRKGQSVAPEYEDTASPRLGFFGVIDERIDMDLLGALAAAHPEWPIYMVGPVVKIDPEELPQAPNLHYLGSRPYAELPSHLAAWDVCLMPFALNDATRYISPTKTLEYMAAEHPVVSTPIRDVAGPYEDIVHLGAGADGFVQACERALTEDDATRNARVDAMRSILGHTSWKHTVKRMEEEVRHVEQRFVDYGRTLELTFGALLRTRDA